jgi:hypothetical protein
MNARIELLNRNLARHDVIIALSTKKMTCDEDLRECDICLGLDYAIEYVKSKLEPED